MAQFATILDWCFPPRPEELRVRTLQPDTLDPTPRHPDTTTVSLLPFAHPDVRALIHEAKFFYNQRAHRLLGNVFASYYAAHYNDALLVPVPLHPRRERTRGFNQVTACLRSQPTLGKHIHCNLLRRQRHTAAQTNLRGEERAANVTNAFTVPNPTTWQARSQQPILLIDDVYTTGATIHAARSALRAAFPQREIRCLTFAYA